MNHHSTVTAMAARSAAPHSPHEAAPEAEEIAVEEEMAAQQRQQPYAEVRS